MTWPEGPSGSPAVTDLVDAALATSPVVEITTTGRRSGRASRIEIWMFAVDGRYVITGTPGPRDWYANLLSEPRLVVHLSRPLAVDLDARARPIFDPEERRSVFTAPPTSWYRSQVGVSDLVAESPMVEVSFPDPRSGGHG